MSRDDAAEWMEAYRKEYQGFKDRDAVKMVIPPRGAKVLGSTTRVDYKVESCMVILKKMSRYTSSPLIGGSSRFPKDMPYNC